MSTSTGLMLSFLRFRARRRGRAQLPAAPDTPRPVSPEPLGPGLAALVRVPARLVPAPATLTRTAPVPRVSREPTMLARAVPEPTPTVLVSAQPDATLPDPWLLTPAATVPTVPVPVMAEPAPPPTSAAMATPGLAAPDDGVETTMLPSRQDAPATTIHPRRTG
jgi:hypothetical protein